MLLVALRLRRLRRRRIASAQMIGKWELMMAWHSWLQLHGWEIELLYSSFAFRRVDGKLVGSGLLLNFGTGYFRLARRGVQHSTDVHRIVFTQRTLARAIENSTQAYCRIALSVLRVHFVAA